jgi:drug/metabolite transporter (DMT)-like permease
LFPEVINNREKPSHPVFLINYMRREYWYIIIAGILYGVIAPGGQFLLDRGLSLYEVSFYRSVLVFVFLLPVVLVMPDRYMLKRDKIPFYALYGLIGGLLELSLFTGIALGVPVALTVLLLYTQPVWTIFIGRLVLGERLTRVKLASVLLGLAGMSILLQSWETGQAGSLAGIAAALAAGVMLSLWVILGKRSAILDQHYVTTTFGWSGFASVWLLLLLPVMDFLVAEKGLLRLSLGFAPSDWAYLAAFAVLGGALPHLLFYRSLERLSASVAGIILLLEPVSATVLAWVFFSQKIGSYLLIGGVLILFSNYLVIRNERIETPVF